MIISDQRWRKTSALAFAVLVLLPANAAEAEVPEARSDYRSYFTDDLQGSGWERCPEPVTWSLDARDLPHNLRASQQRTITRALNAWSRSTGMTFTYLGPEDLAVAPGSVELAPVSGPVRSRHVYIGVLAPQRTTLLDSPVAGRGSPTRVWPDRHVIDSGQVLVSAEYVRANATLKPRHVYGLYLHEIGHALGLGHAERTVNVMYSELRGRRELGPGDRVGGQALTRDCTARGPAQDDRAQGRAGAPTAHHHVPSRHSRAPSPQDSAQLPPTEYPWRPS